MKQNSTIKATRLALILFMFCTLNSCEKDIVYEETITEAETDASLKAAWKNGYKLTEITKYNGYDWWWHSFVATNEKTGELKPFFIEYYVINPGLFNGEIVLGQAPEHKEKGRKPCYAMMKVGAWGEDKAQLHNFYPISDFYAAKYTLDCRIGENTLTETALKGEVFVSEEDSKRPEMMTDAGSMKWDLKVEKELEFDVGYGSGNLFNKSNAFAMYWHVQGMRSKYSGEIIFNGEKYIVYPETSYGYQDKNWGGDYTNPWIWLNCNNFISKKTNERVDASFDLGGGCPKIFGISIDRRILTAFYYKGKFIEFNFSKFWKKVNQKFDIREDEKYVYWDVVSENSKYRIEVNFRCEKSKLLLVNYENPAGEKNHQKLWNGGHAEGTLKFYKKEWNGLKLIDELEGKLGGCEYGEY
ncbi:MAG: tocopherol cyclase family protein [Bacteroidales bacterium]|nr:tocopherol cyclase family protein [Bacteroidales bacterium]